MPEVLHSVIRMFADDTKIYCSHVNNVKDRDFGESSVLG